MKIKIEVDIKIYKGMSKFGNKRQMIQEIGDALKNRIFTMGFDGVNMIGYIKKVRGLK